MAIMNYGMKKIADLDPLSQYRFNELSKKRDQLASRLRSLLDPSNRLGRWSPHYLPTLLDLYRIEMQIDGFCYGQDLEASETH